MIDPLQSHATGNFYHPPPAWVRWTLRILPLIALGSAVFLAWVTITQDTIAGCGVELFNCNKVLQTKWSSWLGIPVSLPAASIYATLLVATWFIGSSKFPQVARAAWICVTVISVILAASAVWFVGLQLLVIRSLCTFCIIVHACGLIIAGITLWRQPMWRQPYPWMYVVGLAPVAVLILGQSLAKDPTMIVLESVTEVMEDETDREVITLEISGEPFPDDKPIHAAALSANSLEGSKPPGDTPPTLTRTPQESTTADLAVTGQTDTQIVALQSDESGKHPLAELFHELESESDDSGAPAQRTNHSSPGDPSLATTSTANPDDTPDDNPEIVDLASRVSKTPLETSDPAIEDQTVAATSSVPNNTTSAAGKNASGSPHRRIITVLNGRARLNPYNQPILGSPDATHVIVELFDYTCHHCRNMHRHLTTARTRYSDDQLAIVALVVPLHSGCNRYVSRTSGSHQQACVLAKLSLAVWRIAPDKFPEYHDWLFDPPEARHPGEAKRKAIELVGSEKLQQQLDHWAVDKQISMHTELYKAAKLGKIPKLLFHTKILQGEIATSKELFHILESVLEEKPK